MANDEDDKQELKSMLAEAAVKDRGAIIVPAELDTSECNQKMCEGWVGTLWPISLVNRRNSIGVDAECFLAYPCNACGALFDKTSEGKKQIRDAIGRAMFFINATLFVKKHGGTLIASEQGLVRGVVGQ